MMNYKPFRFWCQKVLPLVYDDSLSYYELLCKLVEYINNTASDLSEIATEMDELRRYVDHYFDTLDVSDAVEKKLDEMAEHGDFDAILENVFNNKLIHVHDSTAFYGLSVPDYGEIPDLNETDILNKLYALFDRLTSYGFVKSVMCLTSDASRLPMYKYTRKADLHTICSNYTTLTQRDECNPTIILQCGLHGNERGSIMAVYNFLLYAMTVADSYYRDNFDIVVIPCANPYGIAHNLRVNENAVNLNRNFPNGWEAYVPDRPNNAKGDSPASEVETQAIMSLIDEYRGNTGAFFFACHDFSITTSPTEAGSLMWVTANERELNMRIAQVIGYIKKRYDADDRLPKDYIEFAQFGLGGSNSPTAQAYARTSGIHEMLCECPQNLTYQGATPRYSTATRITANLIFPNMITSLADFCYRWEQGAHFYDLKDFGCSNKNTVAEIEQALPQGASVRVFVGNNDSVLRNDLPIYYGRRYAGILEITRIKSEESTAGVVTWTMTGGATPKQFVCTFDSAGQQDRRWHETIPSLIGDDDVAVQITNKARDNITFNDLTGTLPAGMHLALYVAQGENRFANLWNAIPDAVKQNSVGGLLICETGAVEGLNIPTIYRFYPSRSDMTGVGLLSQYRRVGSGEVVTRGWFMQAVTKVQE